MWRTKENISCRGKLAGMPYIRDNLWQAPASSVAPASSLLAFGWRMLRASNPCRITCRCEIRSCRWRCKERGGEAAFVGATSKEGLRAPVKALTLLCAAAPP